MPIKSTGCATCRKRKIRCDETRPKCNRCKTHGVPCPGYRTPAPGEVKFHDETHGIVMQYGGGRGASQGRRLSADSGKGSSIISWSSSPDVLNTVEQEIDMSALFLHPANNGGNPLDFASVYPTPNYIPSPALEKSQIYSKFIDTYLPKRIGAQDAHFSFLSHILSTPNLRPEVTTALDALSMVQVGSTFNDPGLLRSAVKSYSFALTGLVRTIGKGENALNDDYVLATVNLLASCEFFDEIAQMGSGWSHHIQGSQQLLKARGPESIQSRLALLLFLNMRHGALSHALIARKACFLGTPDWRAVAYRVPVVDNSTLLYDSGLQIPAILERFDALEAQADKPLEEIDALLEHSRRLEAEMRNWFLEFQRGAEIGGIMLWSLADVDCFSTFAGLVSDRTITEFFAFPNFMIAYLVCVYWDLMHFLRTTIQKLHMARHRIDHDWYPEPGEMVVEEELLEYVMNMCRCFAYFCEPMSSSTGQIGIFLPMRTAAIYFTTRGNWTYLKWVGAVKDNVFVKGMHPPSARAIEAAQATSSSRSPSSSASPPAVG
ncbi:unnamed protein product [Zymoseptoria tritici ST99CH_3D1]|uniref:Zn(2)-C6 fungal-type domain-containing protein n=1 Tax=Zymoseptoria tritici ST99CH_1E4 TaxID=1276532 RepID=A0A2H1GP90_ZYMTR|nr:unnamed protein product [Zymoseptoria tritici ST99CH_1E4]SMR57762.1 unnamed protein product [Zymoseptoria tritici ST99CH_3D1]